jgi:hypothetical protein
MATRGCVTFGRHSPGADRDPDIRRDTVRQIMECEGRAQTDDAVRNELGGLGQRIHRRSEDARAKDWRLFDDQKCSKVT